VIRHVAIFTLRDGVDPSRVTTALDLLRERVPGPMKSTYGPDAGLRAGNGGYAAAYDFVDAAAYKAWDTDPEHERIRRELMAPLLAGVQRCQFDIPTN
jgi:hypothetical protein